MELNFDTAFPKMESKSDKRAALFRESGNGAFKSSKFSDALFLYNKSLAYSASKDASSLAYANRSAVYLEIGRYKECLQNIQWARQNGYKNAAKLDEREGKCKKLMAQRDPTEKYEEEKNRADFIKLSYSAHEKIPWIVDCVEMKWTKDMGRGIYAKKDLNAGDIISIEKLLMFFPLATDLYRRCFSCGKFSMMNLIPCDKCASIMFCSEYCRNNFYKKDLCMLGVTSAIIRAVSECSALAGGLQKLKAFAKKNSYKKLKKTIFDYDWNNPNDLKRNENLLTCFMSLASDRPDLSYEIPADIKNLVPTDLAHHFRKLIRENFQIERNIGERKDKSSFSTSTIGLFTSLLNHSCRSNAYLMFVEDQAITILSRPVKAGEQICINYVHPLDTYEREFPGMPDLFKDRLPICNCPVCKGEMEVPGLSNQFYIYSNQTENMKYQDLKALFCSIREYINQPAYVASLRSDIDIVTHLTYVYFAIARALRFPYIYA